MLLLREREIAEIDAPFGMSPNSFSTLWISFKGEDGLAFFTDTFQLISCKSPWVKFVGFPPP